MFLPNKNFRTRGGPGGHCKEMERGKLTVVVISYITFLFMEVGRKDKRFDGTAAIVHIPYSLVTPLSRTKTIQAFFERSQNDFNTDLILKPNSQNDIDLTSGNHSL